MVVLIFIFVFFQFLQDGLGLPTLNHEYRHFVILLDPERYSMSPCGNDVEDELALELEDNPETTIGTTYSVLHRNFPILGQM